MNRRQALMAALTAAGTVGAAVDSRGEDLVRGVGEIPGAIALKVAKPIDLRVVSNPIKYKGQTFTLLSIGRGTFERKSGKWIAVPKQSLHGHAR